MSREFDGVNDLMTYSVTTPATALTMLMVLKILNATDSAWLSFMEFETAPGTNRAAMGRENSAIGHLYLSSSSLQYHNASAGEVSDADGWMIVAVTKAAGTVTPRMHKMVVGGSAFHNDAGGTLQDPTAGNQLKLGGDSDFANMRAAVAAFWTSELSDANLNTIHSALTTQSILDLSPAWCVDDGNGDGLATDLVGSADRTALEGTTDSADDPPGWVYFGEATGPSQRFMWLP